MSSCTRPILALDFGIDENGKHIIKILPRRADMNITTLRARYGDMLVLLPCGSCLSCRASRSKDWANRCFLESLYHEKNYFITLTYDNSHCPRELVKRDLQEFIKSLRNNGSKIRYFAAGEYGEVSKRPHYHMLSFGLDIPDLELFNVDEENRKYYTSDFISSHWNKGHVLIAEMTPETICYTARYCIKKLGCDDYKKEFILMSRRPGLGSKWLDEHYKELFYDQHIYCGEYGVKGLSRYIKEYLKKHDPDWYEEYSKISKLNYSKKLISNRINMKMSEELILESSHQSSISRDSRNKRGCL